MSTTLTSQTATLRQAVNNTVRTIIDDNRQVIFRNGEMLRELNQNRPDRETGVAESRVLVNDTAMRGQTIASLEEFLQFLQSEGGNRHNDILAPGKIVRLQDKQGNEGFVYILPGEKERGYLNGCSEIVMEKVRQGLKIPVIGISSSAKKHADLKKEVNCDARHRTPICLGDSVEWMVIGVE